MAPLMPVGPVRVPTLLIAHNIDLAPRIAGLKVGDTVGFFGGTRGAMAIRLVIAVGSAICSTPVSRYHRAYTNSVFTYMALNIDDPEAERLAREVAKAMGETLTTAVIQSLRERLARVRRRQSYCLGKEILKIGRRCAELRLEDAPPADEILGFDERGLPRGAASRIRM